MHVAILGLAWGCCLLALRPGPVVAAVEPVEWIALAVPVGVGAPAPHSVAAWATLRLQRDGLMPIADSLGVARVMRSAEGTRVLLVQRTPGGRIEGVGCAAWIGVDGVLRSMIGSVLRERVPPPPAPDVTRRVVEFVWLLGDDGARWVSLESHAPTGGLPRRQWRDAVSGVLVREDAGVAHAPGRAFATDGASEVVDVELAGLPPHATRLSGRRVGIDEPVRGAIEAPAGDFRFEPSGAESTAFDHVNAYWHVDRFLDQELGAMGGQPPSESLIVQVRMPIAPQVAIASGRYLLLGYPIPGFTREPWRAGDLMRHEATHALLFDLGLDGTGADREAIALHEGLADYLAAAATGDPAIGEWLYVQYPLGVTRVDRPAAEFCYENFDEVRWGGVAAGSSWGNGMILSGALWDLRQSIGGAADSLVVGAMQRLPPAPRWRDLAAAMLAADWYRHDGRHALAIITALAGRGIVARTGVEIAGPLLAEPGTHAAFQVVRRFADPAAQTRWFTRAWCGALPCSSTFIASGSGPVLSLPVSGELEVLVQSTAPSGSLVSSQRFIAVAPPHAIDGPRSAARGDTVEYTARSRSGAIETVRWTRRGLQAAAGEEQVTLSRALRFVATEPFRIEAAMPGAWRSPSATVLEVPVVAVVSVASEPLTDALRVVRSGRELMECRLVLAAASREVALELFDVAGRRTQTLYRGPLAAGEHTQRIELAHVPVGLHLLRLRTERGQQVERVVRLR